MNEQKIVMVEKLRKEYDSLVALNSIDLAIPEGEIFGLIGPNGAGKTTLLNILATYMRPDFGRASICGLDIEKAPLRVRRKIGFMPDFFNLYEDMVTEDFITYFGLAFGVERQLLPGRVSDLLRETNLLGKRHALIRDLSRGMRQRLTFAKTLIHDPELLLLDEPLSGLDPLARMEMRKIFRSLRDKGKTVIISSHILTELSEFCTMVGIIEKGEMKVCGRIDEVLKRFHRDRVVTIEVLNNGENARRVIEGFEGVLLDPGSDNVIKFRCRERETISGVNAALVNSGLQVVSLLEEKADIEDIYFKVAPHEVS